VKKRGTVEFRINNGNGGHKMFSLSWWQSLTALVAACAAIFFGSTRAVVWAGSAQINQWFDKEGLPKIEKVIDTKITKYQMETELHLQKIVTELRIEVERLKAISGVPGGG
jgi:hypothetical protein